MATTPTTNKKIIVDIDVRDCRIRASKPDIQTAMPVADDAAKELFWNRVPTDRLNKHTYGHLKDEALREAEKVVDTYGAINLSGMYGSIEIDEKDFVPWDKTSQH